MTTPSIDPSLELASAVAAYRDDANVGALRRRLATVTAALAADPDALAAAAEPYRDIPEVAGPIYERVVAARPDDARALVILGGAYWLAGRDAEVVSELASRAIAADPASRAAWHLWALTGAEQRARVARWRQVVERFPADELARANLADSAASLAGGEGDPDALALALATYESLLATAAQPEQRAALERAIATLREWRL